MSKRQKNHSDWSQLPEDLVRNVMERIPLLELINFTCVCSSWRCISIAKLTQLRHSPWEIVPSMCQCLRPKSSDILRNDFCCDGSVSFHCITTGKTYKEQMPETRGRGVRVASPGCLITIHPTQNTNRLYHVFSRKVLDLPPFPNPLKSYMPITKAVAYSNTSSQLVIAAIQHVTSYLYFYSRGDKSWQNIILEDNCHYCDITFYKEDLYAMKYSGELNVVKGLKGSSIPSVSLVTSRKESEGRSYLVASSENLYLVTMVCKLIERKYVLDTMEVWNLDFTKCQWVKVVDLGGCSLFISPSSSFSSTASSFPGCRRNCVYFSTYSGHGIFSLEDGTVEKLFPSKYKHFNSFFLATLTA